VEIAFSIGLELEPMLARRMQAELAPQGLTLHRTDDPNALGVLLAPPDMPWACGHADGLIYDGSGWPVAVQELKTSRQGREWWTDDGQPCVPPGYEVQALFYLYLAREIWPSDPPDRIEFIVLDLMGCSTMRRTINWDSDKQATCAAMIPHVQQWWQRHILDGQEPPADSSELCQAWYLSQLPKAKPALEGGEIEQEAALAYLAARDEGDAADKAKTRARGALLQILRGHDTDRISFETGPVKSVSISASGSLLVQRRKAKP